MPISINSDSGNIFAGGGGADGDVVLRAEDGRDRIRLDAGSGNVWIGGNGADGDIVIFPPGGDNVTLQEATIHLDGGAGNIFAGGNGTDGDLVLRDTNGADRIRLDAGGGNIWLGGNGADGDIVLFADTGDNATLGDATIRLNGQAGDIILQNADGAEDFEVEALCDAAPGTVMVIGEGARLRMCESAYDRRVAGVIAGAGTCRPGIILGRKLGTPNALPIALFGRTFVKVDASHGAVRVGDLLTTSPSPGHAMRADDSARSFGAVIGKALSNLDEGQGLIPALVSLQ